MDKNTIFTEKTDLAYGRSYVYSLQYQIMWCTKYRKQVLRDGIDQRMRELLEKIASEYQFRIMAMEVMPDYIHLLFDCKLQFYIPDMVRIMKGEHSQTSVYRVSAAEGQSVGRSPVEPFLLCGIGQ